jgi:hypothetical protein
MPRAIFSDADYRLLKESRLRPENPAFRPASGHPENAALHRTAATPRHADAGKTTPCIRVRAPGSATKKVAPAKTAKPELGTSNAFISESENPAPFDDEVSF